MFCYLYNLSLLFLVLPQNDFLENLSVITKQIVNFSILNYTIFKTIG